MTNKPLHILNPDCSCDACKRIEARVVDSENWKQPRVVLNVSDQYVIINPDEIPGIIDLLSEAGDILDVWGGGSPISAKEIEAIVEQLADL